MKNSNLAIILEISQRLMATLEIEAVLEQTVQLLHQKFGYTRTAIFLIDGEALELKATSGSESSSFARGYSRPVGEGIAGLVASSGEKIVANDYSSQSPVISANDPKSGSQLCLPLKTNAQADILGVLDIFSSRPNAFSEEDVAALEALASCVATAIQNAHRHRAVRQELQDLRQAHKELRKSEERFRQVVASISAHIYVTEVTDDGQLINHYIGPNVELLTGYPHENFIKEWSFWPSTVIYPEDRELAATQIERLKQGETSTAEYRLTRADGQIIWVRDSGRAEKQNDSRMIYGVVTDITERKKAEQALIQERTSLAKRVAERTSELSAANAKLARAARLKDEFLANMSHELRTPLNAILGMAEVLHSGVYGELNAEQRNATDHIAESGKHLLSLITDILDLSKIEAEKLELEISPVFVDYVCETSLRLVSQIAKKKQITISSEYDERVKIVKADQRRLKQILVNLLSNAVKFTPEGGQIGLYVRGDASEEQVHFIVWDTGIGIAQEKLDHLFKPFIQLDSRLSRQHEGTGLGLSLVARLAELHGGGVSVESHVGEGSRFTISLPWQEIEANDVISEMNDRPPSATDISSHVLDPMSQIPPLILLAEDNEANVITLTEFLQGLEYRVVVARNGKEAIQQAIEEKPNLILMDIQMPELNGLEAIQQIRKNGKIGNVPIVALTALAMPKDRERCLEAGANEYLSKPVSLKKLVEVIETQLKNNQHSN